MSVAYLIVGPRIPLLVSRANGTVEQPDRVKNLSPSSHLRLLPTRAGRVTRMRLPLWCFARVLVGMLAERYLLSVDLPGGAGVKRRGVEVEVGCRTSSSKLSDVTGSAETRC